MLTLKVIGPNQTELTTDGDTIIFFSYNTPVAAVIQVEYYRTYKFWSNTTSRNINKWSCENAIKVPQEFFNNLI